MSMRVQAGFLERVQAEDGSPLPTYKSCCVPPAVPRSRRRAPVFWCTSDLFLGCRRGSSMATAAARRGHIASCDAAGIFKPDVTIALFVFHQLAAHH